MTSGRIPLRSVKNTAANEQRKHARLPVGVSLDFRLSGGDSAVRCRGVISDVSSGGMTLQTDAVLEEGMTLHLRLPSSMEIRGEIRHAGGPVSGRRRYGVRFHKIGYAAAH
jgi:hypothetical protein